MARTISKNASRRQGWLMRLIARDGDGCVWCAARLSPQHPNATIEHVQPRSTGGPNVFENMLLACGPCNSARQSTPAEQWAADCQRRGQAVNTFALTRALATFAALEA